MGGGWGILGNTRIESRVDPFSSYPVLEPCPNFNIIPRSDS